MSGLSSAVRRIITIRGDLDFPCSNIKPINSPIKDLQRSSRLEVQPTPRSAFQNIMEQRNKEKRKLIQGTSCPASQTRVKLSFPYCRVSPYAVPSTTRSVYPALLNASCPDHLATLEIASPPSQLQMQSASPQTREIWMSSSRSFSRSGRYGAAKSPDRLKAVQIRLLEVQFRSTPRAF